MKHLLRAMHTIGILFTLLLTQASFAAGVIQMPFRQLVMDSELAFEGRVIAIQSAWNATGSAIVTHVTFAVHDILKGSVNGSVRLTFAGGAIDGKRMTVSGLRIPHEGEVGIYFIESSNGNLLSPVLGWNQGHFLIGGTVGKQHVLTSEGRSVRGFTNEMVTSIELNEHQPSGLAVGDHVGDAMSPAAFKLHVRDLLVRAQAPQEVVQ